MDIICKKVYKKIIFYNCRYLDIFEWKTVKGGNWEKPQDRNNEVSAEWMALESNFLQ